MPESERNLIETLGQFGHERSSPVREESGEKIELPQKLT